MSGEHIDIRIAKLEVHAEEREKDIAAMLIELRKHMEDEEKRWETIVTRMEAIENRFTKYSGFVGGMLFVVASVWTVFTFAARYWNG